MMQRALAHPCAGSDTACCGYAAASFVLRFESFLAATHGSIVLIYEAWPMCGDGLDVELLLTSGV